MTMELFKKKTKDGVITIMDFKLYDKAMIIKIAWYWHIKRHIDQCSRIESSEMNLQLYGQLIFNKAGKNIQWKKTISLTNDVGNTGQ